MNASQATRFASLALKGLEREFPFNPAHVQHAERDLLRPRELHPAFHGCYDWHSAAHAHWLLAHVLRRFPDGAQAASIRALLQARLTAGNLLVEARYLREHPAFERPYGWTWVLKLAHEVDLLREPQSRDWRVALAPLVEVIEQLYLDWLPRQVYPIRAGVHTNTAFGLAFALDYARAAHRGLLEKTILEKAHEYYGNDADYPAAWEPGGNDFLSPCLVEADLMQRVLPNFSEWFARFLPRLPDSLLRPATVSDRSDGQLVHLDGLNLSRAWCFFRLGERQAGERHLAAGLEHLESGHYAGEHWLATFAAYALDAATTTPAARSRAT